ncbi:MAG: branched-chain amino acid ABC transporter permease [Ignavibacteriales bacterium]|nr:MAG: branched-chain amino acid ABC transporter permease [Ignavibacteriales bacterium]
MNYIFHIIIMINIYIILTTSTNLLVGMTNLLSLGQAALYGIGAYLAVLALMALHLSLLPTLIFVILGTSLLSLLVAYPSLRLRGDYFVLATLGFQLIVFTILYNWVSVTKGPYGIPGIPSLVLFGDIIISGIIPYLILSSIFAIGVIIIFYKLIHSPFGRALKAVRDDELSAQAIGRNVTALKIWAFVVSSGFIGISGLLYASYVSYIDPTSFNLDEAIFILSAVIIGGTGNIKGPIVGAVFVVVLPELLRFVGLPDSVAANLRQIIYGLMIIILMRLRPQGLAGEYALK